MLTSRSGSPQSSKVQDSGNVNIIPDMVAVEGIVLIVIMIGICLAIRGER